MPRRKELNESGIDFVWITDGAGWVTTQRPLRAAFNSLDYLWNLTWLAEDFLLDLFSTG